VSTLDSSRLTICIDFKSPHAYLANEPTWVLLDELSIDATWLPIVLPPLQRGPAASAGNDRGLRHRRRRAEYVEQDLRRYARVRGLSLGDLYRNPDVTYASIALLSLSDAAKDVRRRFVTNVFDGYWRESLDIEDPSAVRRVLSDAGADAEQLDEDAGRERLAIVARELAEAGVFSAPAYIIEGESYYGRAHLPMIRWLLTERVGPPPL
jgi:2-hydroxychromene-2-carboxylate isomerase